MMFLLELFYLNHFMYYIDFYDYCILCHRIIYVSPLVEVEQTKNKKIYKNICYI